MTRLLPIRFFSAAVGASILCGSLLAQTSPGQPPPGLEFQGRTTNSAVWLKTDSVTEISDGVRVATFLQNTAIDLQFTDGRELTLRSIQIQIQVNCSDGTYRETAEVHFTQEFAKGEQIWASVANRAYWGWMATEHLQTGSMMHLVVNSICSQRLSQRSA